MHQSWKLAFMLAALVASGCAQAPTPFANAQGTPYPPMPNLDPTLVSLGRQVYQANCASCHGAQAEGAPNWKVPDAQGNYPAPPHNDEGHTWHHSDRVLYEIVRDGFRDPLRPNSPLRMPAFGVKSSDAEIRAVLVYFKSLWTKEHQEFQWARTVEDDSPAPTPPRPE